MSEEEAWQDVLKVWDPHTNPSTPQWPRFIAAAQEKHGG